MALSCIRRKIGKEKVLLNYNFQFEIGCHFPILVGK
jgi:hypothetical protein